jgi:hypothetical protein
MCTTLYNVQTMFSNYNLYNLYNSQELLKIEITKISKLDQPKEGLLSITQLTQNSPLKKKLKAFPQPKSCNAKA